jgi:hypothetical protein
MRENENIIFAKYDLSLNEVKDYDFGEDIPKILLCSG